MKSLLLSLVAMVALAASPVFGQELAIGEKAPMATGPLVGVDGTSHTLLNLKEANGLLVVFSCNTCPFVVGNGTKTEGWEGRYNGLAELAESLQVGMVLVNSNEAKRDGDDSFTAMKNHARDAEYTMPYVVDEGSKLANACGARTTPHVYLFNSNLELTYRGSIDDNVNRSDEVTERYLEVAMTRMAEGKKIKTAETKAVGCSIKRLAK
ncbi:MAG: thioredoxin family protein [Flavobacteriales bacterium]|nr:thioredoxin family protein [Flavobacteriales bacterium]